MTPAPRSRGKLISFEGVDGVGKSTAIAGVAEALRDLGLEVVTLREPGGTVIGERIRALLKDPALAEGRPGAMDAKTEALLFAAARAQITAEVIAPALLRGAWVLVDRFVHSSVVYQGHARGLGPAVEEVSRFALAGVWPDRVLLLELSAQEATKRRGGRSEAADRIELAGGGFLARVEAGYRQLALEDQTVRPLSAAGSPEEVVYRCLEEILPLLDAAQQTALTKTIPIREVP